MITALLPLLLSRSEAIQAWPPREAVSIMHTGRTTGSGGSTAGKRRMVLQGGSIRFAAAPPKSPSTTHALIVPKSGGTFFRFAKGFLYLFARGDQLLVGGAYTPVEVGTFQPGEPLLVSVVVQGKETKLYVNGKRVQMTLFIPLTDITIGHKDWRGEVVDVVTYRRAQSASQVAKEASMALPKPKSSLPAGWATLDATLGAFTPVPDPARIKPYRNALLAHEYTVQSVKDGHIKGLKPGGTVRVFRFGVWDGKRTALENLKAGDKVRLTIKPLSSDPVLEREYQLDDLAINVSATYYVEVPAAGKNP